MRMHACMQSYDMHAHWTYCSTHYLTGTPGLSNEQQKYAVK